MTKTKKEKIFYITNRKSHKIAVSAISKIMPAKEKRYAVKVYLDTEDRTSKQNRLAFLWYKFRAPNLGWTPEYDRSFCKLTYGVPILLADSEFFEFYNNALLILPYEEKLQAMEFVPVTSLMSTKQFAEYLDTIDRESAMQGMQLPQPIDLYYDALMKREM